MLIVYTSTPLSTLFSPDDWHRPRKLGTGSYNTLAIDPEGTVHAAWGEPIFEHWGGPCDGDVPCYGCADIHYSRSTDGGLTWILPVKLARTLGGRLRVALPLSFGLLHLAPLIDAFSSQHPAIEFELDFNDRQVDLMQEGFDVAIRIAQLEDSSLIARRLTVIRHTVCASPAYLSAHGLPIFAALACLAFTVFAATSRSRA